jgi:hypothetical protein
VLKIFTKNGFKVYFYRSVAVIELRAVEVPSIEEANSKPGKCLP